MRMIKPPPPDGRQRGVWSFGADQASQNGNFWMNKSGKTLQRAPAYGTVILLHDPGIDTV